MFPTLVLKINADNCLIRTSEGLTNRTQSGSGTSSASLTGSLLEIQDLHVSKIPGGSPRWEKPWASVTLKCTFSPSRSGTRPTLLHFCFGGTRLQVRNTSIRRPSGWYVCCRDPLDKVEELNQHYYQQPTPRPSLHLDLSAKEFIPVSAIMELRFT